MKRWAERASERGWWVLPVLVALAALFFNRLAFSNLILARGDTFLYFYADALWTLQRSAIVSLFLFCAGLSLALALHHGQRWPRFWRRWAARF